ncbi:MAG: hypothetical protein K2Q09_00435, partial [Phycisphaerales bacterium]|nr:hypothetical protein [Phycisphaerales bacterium]
MLPATRSSLSLSRPHAAGDAARIRMLAGTPYSRRGSVLVLVVGVLALLAIIIVVYTSVGQADVRGGRAMVNKSRLDDQSHAMADYIARLVGEDASATKVQPVSMASGGPAFLSVHEGMDYPYTDPFARSILTIAYSVPAADKDFARFSPVGTITTPYTANGGLDPRVPSDPWLASTEPTWINNGFATLPPVPAPGQLLGHQRDWQHMSIIAPSGLPVNLAMLRGNFTAASGFTPRPYQADATRISDWMYVWRASAANSNYLAASDARQVTGLPAAYNTPATWSNDCTDTFRPVTWNPANKLVLGDVKWMGNRLADADGDGFYDSVWQELVDVSDINNPVNLLPGGTGGGVRWFIAPRIIDLSGLVNVNTATSFAVPPDAENPAGLTPSDIDLERLLTTADIRQYFDLNPVNDLIGGNQFQAGGNIDALTVAGKWAFNGLFESRATGMTEASDNQVSSADPAGTELNVPSWLREIGVDRGGRRVAIGSVTRKTLYYTGGNDDTRQLRNPVGTNGNYYVKQGSGFGLADELELRKFNGLNDPTVRSRLEAVTQYAPTGQPNLYSASPLRPDRDLVAERDAAIVPGNNATIDGEQVPRAMAQHFFDVRHLLTTISGARPFGYSASLIANPLTPTATAARPLGESELRVDVNTLLESAVSVTTATNNVYPLGSANTIFQNYAMALSPFLGNLGFTGSPSGSESLWLDATGGANLRNLTLTFGGVSYKPLTNRADI